MGGIFHAKSQSKCAFGQVECLDSKFPKIQPIGYDEDSKTLGWFSWRWYTKIRDKECHLRNDTGHDWLRWLPIRWLDSFLCLVEKTSWEKSIHPSIHLSWGENGSQGALEKRKNKVVRQINKLDMDGEEPNFRHKKQGQGISESTHKRFHRRHTSEWMGLGLVDS